MVVERSRPLPFWIFFITGFLIAGYAQFVIYSYSEANKGAMTLFTYIGFLLIFIGLVKLIYGWVVNKEEKVAKNLSGVDEIDTYEEKMMKKYGNSNNSNVNKKVHINNNQPINNINQNQNNNSNEYVYCSKCGNRAFKGDLFCTNCGNKLR